MNFFIRSLLLLSLACLPAVQAADSGWLRDAQNNHADVRLRSAPQGSTTQLLLDIRLESGWKTYWRTPGEGALHPQFTGSSLAFKANGTGQRLRVLTCQA